MNKTCGNCANYDCIIGFAQICGKCIYDQYANDFERAPSEWKPGKHFTKADAIRAMSDEELADLLYNFSMSNIVERGKTEIAMRADKYHIELWLRTPYKENTDD